MRLTPACLLTTAALLTRTPPPCMMATDADALDPTRDDPWKIIGIERGADMSELRRAYRRKARTLHPDVSSDPEAATKFRRLVAAFETLSDDVKRSAYETQRKRSSAKSRAQRAWDDLNRRASSSSSSSSSGSSWGAKGATAEDRPAGSRREAEARTREESDRRRQRWREIAFEEIFREHMPLDYSVSSPARAAFVAELEVAVQTFVRRQQQGGGGGRGSGSGSAGAAAAPAAAAADGRREAPTRRSASSWRCSS